MAEQQSDEPLPVDFDVLARLAAIGEPHHHAMLEAVRAEFGDVRAVTLHTLLLAMQLGHVLRTIRNADLAPDGIAAVWALMDVPFALRTEARALMRPPAAERDQARLLELETLHADAIAAAEAVVEVLAVVLRGPPAALVAAKLNRELAQRGIQFAVWRRAARSR